MNGFYCHTCNRSFTELDLWGHIKWCGDHYKCTACGDDIKRDVTLEMANKLADMFWNLPPDNGQFEELFDGWD